MKTNNKIIILVLIILVLGGLIFLLCNSRVNILTGTGSTAKSHFRKPPGTDNPPNMEDIRIDGDQKGHYRLTYEDSTGKLLGVAVDSVLNIGEYNILDTISCKLNKRNPSISYYIVLYFNSRQCFRRFVKSPPKDNFYITFNIGNNNIIY